MYLKFSNNDTNNTREVVAGRVRIRGWKRSRITEYVAKDFTHRDKYLPVIDKDMNAVPSTDKKSSKDIANRRFPCEMCSAKFTTEEDLSRHREKNHIYIL
jgi:hypothetical protein